MAEAASAGWSAGAAPSGDIGSARGLSTAALASEPSTSTKVIKADWDDLRQRSAKSTEARGRDCTPARSSPSPRRGGGGGCSWLRASSSSASASNTSTTKRTHLSASNSSGGPRASIGTISRAAAPGAMDVAVAAVAAVAAVVAEAGTMVMDVGRAEADKAPGPLRTRARTRSHLVGLRLRTSTATTLDVGRSSRPRTTSGSEPFARDPAPTATARSGLPLLLLPPPPPLLLRPPLPPPLCAALCSLTSHRKRSGGLPRTREKSWYE